MAENGFSVLVFPFLRTSRPVELGGVTLRSTVDCKGLSDEQASAVGEVADMIFLKDNRRISNAVYAIIPPVNLETYDSDTLAFENIQAVIAYLYAAPQGDRGDPFMSFEHASAFVVSPGRIPASLVRPDDKVEVVAPDEELVRNQFDEVAGYRGLYNFRHFFWVAKGSRIYGPLPQMGLFGVDLWSDIRSAVCDPQKGYGLLLGLLDAQPSPLSPRALTAVRWFNDANCDSDNQARSIVSLAVAFESLLGLPRTEKTERLVDAIALILGRVPRLDSWASQFYEARGAIVHEGATEQLRYRATDSPSKAGGRAYQPLLSYGRRIFRLCLATLLVGADLARKAELEELLVTNQERFERICRALKDSTISPRERLASIQGDVELLDRYKFLWEDGLEIKTMVAAVRLAGETLLDTQESSAATDGDRLRDAVKHTQSQDRFTQLDGVRRLKQQAAPPTGGGSLDLGVFQRLVKVVWGYVDMTYYYLRRERTDEPNFLSSSGEE